MDQAQVRPARPADAAALVEIYLSSADHHLGIDRVYYRAPDREALLASYRNADFAREDAAVFVAELHGRVVGAVWVWLGRHDDPASMIRPATVASVDIAVLDGHRRRGVGRRLVEAVDSWSGERGATSIVLDTHARNTGAVRFYEALGYEQLGVVLRRRLGG